MLDGLKNGKYEEDGVIKFYKNGRFHREDGPAIKWESGSEEWYLNGWLHREGKPAVEHPGAYRAWFVYGFPHREDGPAVEWLDGMGRSQWWICGTQVSEQEFNKRMSK
ncbi:hypothetical protein [Ralstonia pseudosolanacearum]